MPDIDPQTGRRDYDNQQGALMVPLREFLEDKIRSSAAAQAAEIRHLSAEIAEAKAASSREHAEVNAQLHIIAAQIAELDKREERRAGGRGLAAGVVSYAALAIAAMAGLGQLAAHLGG
jgi:superfamily I DNA and RNA helicase